MASRASMARRSTQASEVARRGVQCAWLIKGDTHNTHAGHAAASRLPRLSAQPAGVSDCSVEATGQFGARRSRSRGGSQRVMAACLLGAIHASEASGLLGVLRQDRPSDTVVVPVQGRDFALLRLQQAPPIFTLREGEVGGMWR